MIVLSQILFWFNVQATYEVIKPPPVPTQETYYGGSVEPTDVGPTEPVPPDAYRTVTETTKVKGLLQARASATCSPRSSATSATSRRWRSSWW